MLSLGLGTQAVHSQKYNPHDLSFHGYFRTGLGQTDGEQMVDFATPDNVHKFRMGNEANHYAELQFNYQFKDKDSVALYEAVYMMSKYIPFGSSNNGQFPETAQLYGKINKLVNNANVWVGKRYYDRRNVESLDYFWINSGQNAEVGFGIENFELKKSGKLHLAFFQFSYPNKIDADKSANSYTADLRYTDVPVTENSKLNFVAQYSQKQKDEVLNLPSTKGFAVGSWHTYSKNHITNTATVLYRKGSSIVESPYSGKTISELSHDTRMYDLDKAHSFDVINNFVYDDKTRHAVQASLTYQHRNYGIGNVDDKGMIIDSHKSKDFFSVGFRYMYYISKHFNLAVEAGNDYMKSTKSGLEGSLQKVTFSPQITWDYGYYSRPVIRPFVTYAHWSDDFRGITGVSAFNTKLKDKNQAISYGLQLEMWW